MLVNRNLDRERKKERNHGEFPLSQNISINKFHESLTVKSAARYAQRKSRLFPSFVKFNREDYRIRVRTNVEFPRGWFPLINRIEAIILPRRFTPRSTPRFYLSPRGTVTLKRIVHGVYRRRPSKSSEP